VDASASAKSRVALLDMRQCSAGDHLAHRFFIRLSAGPSFVAAHRIQDFGLTRARRWT
jgi:hypothetical protein